MTTTITAPVRHYKKVHSAFIRKMYEGLKALGYTYENGTQQMLGSIPEWLALHSDGTVSAKWYKKLPRTEKVESPVFLKLAPLSIVALNRIFGDFDCTITVQGDEELYVWEELSWGDKIPRAVPWRQPYVELAYAVHTTIAPADANVFGALSAERQSIVLKLIERRMQLPNALDFVAAHGENAVEAHEAAFNHALDVLALDCIQANTGQRAQRVESWRILYAFASELTGFGETVFEPYVVTMDVGGMPTSIEVQKEQFWITMSDWSDWSDWSDENSVYSGEKQGYFEKVGPAWVWPIT